MPASEATSLVADLLDVRLPADFTAELYALVTSILPRDSIVMVYEHRDVPVRSFRSPPSLPEMRPIAFVGWRGATLPGVLVFR